MIEQLDKLNGFVNEYYKMKIDVRNGDKLNYLLQKITGLLYYLETERSQIHDAFDFQSFIIEKAIQKGRIGIFADTGLGKTLIQLSIAKSIVNL